MTAEEVWELRMQYAPKSRLARLDWTPLILLRHGEVRLFDAVPQYRDAEAPDVPRIVQAQCYPPKPYPTLRTISSDTLQQSRDKQLRSGLGRASSRIRIER